MMIESPTEWLLNPTTDRLLKEIKDAMNHVKNGDGDNRYIILTVAVAKLNEVRRRLMKENA